MPIRTIQQDGVLLFVPEGDLDAHELEAMDAEVTRALERGVNHHLWDLGQVRLLPSTAAGFLIGCGRRVSSAGGRMALCALPLRARVTLDTMGVLDLFVRFETREAALADLR